MRIRVCDYCQHPVVYEVYLRDAKTLIDTCRLCVVNAVSIGVDNMANTEFTIRYVGEAAV